MSMFRKLTGTNTGASAQLCLGFVIAISAWAGWFAFQRHWMTSSEHWNRLDIDAHSHLAVIMSLANDVWRGDLVGWYRDFDGPRSWPPLHGVLGSIIQIIAGKPDARWAILPSIIGWVLTSILAFLITRRLSPWFPSLAGSVAALLVLASPSHRAFAADVMLESLGAMLTLLVVWFYIRARQDHRASDWWGVAWSLTALLVEKYNYWVLVAVPIAILEIGPILRGWLPEVRTWVRTSAWKELRQPWTALCWISGLVGIGGFLAGKRGWVRDDAFFNVLNAFAVFLFIRLIFWWRKGGHHWMARQPVVVRAAALGHLLPMLCWFMLPKRFGFFLRYITMRHTDEEFGGFTQAFSSLASMAATYYHAEVWIAVAMGLAAVLGIMMTRKLSPGALVVLAVFLFSLVATGIHPRKLSRCLHTWMALGWIFSGIGWAFLVHLMTIPSFMKRLPVRTALACLLVGVAGMMSPSFARRGISSESYHNGGPTTLGLAEFMHSRFAQAQSPAFFANLPIGDVATWTFIERFPGRPKLDCFVRRFGTNFAANEPRLRQWFEQSRSDVIVYVEVDQTSPVYFPAFEHYRQYGDYLNHRQRRFQKVDEHRFDELGLTASVWKPVAGIAERSETRPRR